MNGQGVLTAKARSVLVIADDLAGAAEAAGALISGSSLPVELMFDAASRPEDPGSVLIIDTDSRYRPDAEARRRVRLALAARPDATIILKKVDSLLRGRIAAETQELVSTGHPVVAAFALPSMRRTVADGVVNVDGVPLHQTNTWAAERTPPPESIGELLAGTPAVIVPLPVIRGYALADALVGIVRSGLLPICDADDQCDLERIADAALKLAQERDPVVLVGTSALARAVGRVLSSAGIARASVPLPVRPVLVVAGTLANSIDSQIDRLIDRRVACIEATLADVVPARMEQLIARVVRALASGVAVVHVDRHAAWHRDDVAVVAKALAAGIDLTEVDLVLTGGETARAVLDAAGISAIYPERELAAGVVLCRTPLGARVVTRPGSFGDEDSLLDIVLHLRPDAGLAKYQLGRDKKRSCT
jgi:4-hydroxythreonine-4-phosphate dehydrogenase